MVMTPRRTIRTKGSLAASKGEKNTEVKGRSIVDLLRAFDETSAKELAETLTKGELSSLIDHAVSIDLAQKAQAVEVKDWKGVFKQYAIDHKEKTLKGEDGMVVLASSTKSSIDVMAFARLLKKEDKAALYPECVSVAITPAKKYLGEETLKEITETTTTDYGTVTLKKKKTRG